MAITKTTVASAVGVNDLIINVTSATGFAAGQFFKVDSEYMRIAPAYVAGGTAIPVLWRGDMGSQQVAHNALAICSTGLYTDLSPTPAGYDVPAPGVERPGVTYSVSGAIAIPTVDTVVVLDKAGVAAMTLAAPTADLDFLMLTIVSTTAQAHTVTATTLFADGTSGSPHTTATFTTGYIGQGMTLMALAGLWQVVSAPHIAFT